MAARKTTAPADVECPKCLGYGLIVGAGGNVEKCDCGQWDGLQYLHALDKARIPKRYRGKTLNTFQVPRGDNQRHHIKKGAMAFATTFSCSEDKGLLLRGGTGTGKTHIAIGILHEVARKNCTCLYCNTTDLLARMRDSYSQKSEEREGEILGEMETADLLVLDDLGAEAATEWVRDRLYLIINRRYEDAKSTIITTNCDDAELSERIGERTVSRLREMCEVIDFPEEDYRRKMMD